jgi:hypothetical protein
MAAAQPDCSARFVRKTELAANEYHKNFFKLDLEIIAAITSEEADRVTPLMSKIYLRLVNAPNPYWEREGVLRFEAEWREGKQVKAWDVLCEIAGVASATANKAIRWLHEQGIIGYFAGKNGVGLRVFLNRASASIGVRTGSSGQKFLRLAPASSRNRHASPDEAAFNDSFAVLEISDTDLNPHAPKNGAANTEVGKTSSDPEPAPTSTLPANSAQGEQKIASANGNTTDALPVDEIVNRLRSALEPSLRAAAVQASQREHERTREWLDKHGIPKATRVAQREAYNVLRGHGLVNADTQRARAQLEVGRSSDSYSAPDARPRTPEEIREIAETCVALLETQGKAIDLTLSEISSEGSGWVLPEDVPRVREIAHTILKARGERSKSR